MKRKAPLVKTPRLIHIIFGVVIFLLSSSKTFAQDYDARIDVTFIKTDSSETRYLSLINYSNQPIELNFDNDKCLLLDESKILSIKEGSLSLCNTSPRGYYHYKTFGAGLDCISNFFHVIDPFSVLIIPIKEPKSNYNDDVYFSLTIPKTTSITLNNYREDYGSTCLRQIGYVRTFFGITYKSAVYKRLKTIPFGVNVNSTLIANSSFIQAIDKTTVIGLREYLSYFCE